MKETRADFRLRLWERDGGLIGPDGTNVKILDNLADMQYGKKPKWKGSALRKATGRNMAVLVPVIDEKWPRKPKDGKE